MTVLSVLNDVQANCGLEVTASVSGSTKEEHVRLLSMLNLCATMIANAHDWQELVSEVSFTGNGDISAFPMPTNYSNVVMDVAPWNKTTNLPVLRVREPSKWHEIERRGNDAVYHSCIIQNGFFNVIPALADGEIIQLYYISENYALGSDGGYKNSFTLDSDQFRLDENLLTLETIGQWKTRNGQATGADFIKQSRELLGQLKAINKGAQVKSEIKVA